MTTTARSDDRIDPQVLRTGLILVVGVIAIVFDTTIVSVALHTLSIDLGASVTTIQWVSTGYLLALGMAVPLSAWGMQRFGGKRLYLVSLVVFLIGSTGASTAWNTESLIAWRVVQGAGGGLLLPVMTTIIMQAAGGKALGKTVTIVALPGLLGPILGPLVGGAILTHLSWRFMFWVNVPFCLVGLVLAIRYLPGDAVPDRRPPLDTLGFAMLAPGVAALFLALSDAGRASGFDHLDVILPLVVGVALTLSFCAHALRRAEPLLDIRLLARRPVGSASAVLFFSGFVLYGAMLLLPLFFQQTRGATALAAGIALIPQGIGSLLSRGLAGTLTDKIGARPIAVGGFVIVAVATLPFAYVTTQTNAWLLAFFLVVRGFGLGIVTIPVMAVAYQGLARSEMAHSSALTRIAQQVGGSFGTAILAVILEQTIASNRGNLVPAFHVAFSWSVGFSAFAAILALWLPGRDRQPADKS